VAAHAIAADAAVPVCEVGAEVARLSRLWRFGPQAGERDPVSPARRFALYGLLRDGLPDADAQRFVRERLGPLIDWDRAHRTDLLRVLEAALDHRRHEDAADCCFMHRNTFRHRLRQATDLLGDDLAHPDARLAVHIALKLRHAVDAETGHGAADGRVVRRAVGAA
jgi:DNA-binding PucR family transcriptional regulator